MTSQVITQNDRDLYSDLAANILASVLAYQFGLRNVAHVRKQYVDSGIPVGDYWIWVAKEAHTQASI